MIRVICAEDNDIIREDLVERLEATGEVKVVFSCASGQEVRSRFSEFECDVVLMDIEMEEMDSGIRASEAILEIDPSAHIIYLTSHDSDRTVMLALATGAEDFVVKGASIEEILGHIKAVCEGHPLLDSRIQRIVMGEYKRLHASEQNLMYFIQHLGALTPAEKELIGYFLEGLKVKEIAQRRFVEPATVKSQIRTLLQKFKCSRTSEIVKIINGLGLEGVFRGN